MPPAVQPWIPRRFTATAAALEARAQPRSAFSPARCSCGRLRRRGIVREDERVSREEENGRDFAEVSHLSLVGPSHVWDFWMLTTRRLYSSPHQPHDYDPTHARGEHFVRPNSAQAVIRNWGIHRSVTTRRLFRRNSVWTTQ
jgi:hypothetical protein